MDGIPPYMVGGQAINDSYSSQPKTEHYRERPSSLFLTRKPVKPTNWVCNALNLANITTTTDPLGNELEEQWNRDLPVSHHHHRRDLNTTRQMFRSC